MAAYIRSVMNNCVSNTVIIEFSKCNESYPPWWWCNCNNETCQRCFNANFNV